MSEKFDKVVDDLQTRGLNVEGFICSGENSDIVYISYDKKGLVEHITKCNTGSISIYQRNDDGTIMEMISLARKEQSK